MVLIDPEYVRAMVASIVKDQDLSRYILLAVRGVMSNEYQDESHKVTFSSSFHKMSS